MAEAWAREPWQAVEGRFFIKDEDGWGSITDAHDWFIAKLEDSLDPRANARRIVACVNALAGFSPESVPDAVASLTSCKALFDDLLSGGNVTDPALRARVESERAGVQSVLERIRQPGG